jgi:hypothetical protein
MLQVYLGREVVQSLPLTPGVRATASWELAVPDADTFVRIDIVRPNRKPNQTPVSLLSNPVLIDVGPQRSSWR